MSRYPNHEVRELRKSGRVDEAYRLGYQLLERYPGDGYLTSELGWVIYEKVTAIAAEAAYGKVSSGNVQYRIRKLFRAYARLELRRPDLLFSLLVNRVVRLSEVPPFLPRFLWWAGIESFRAEDFQAQRDNEKGTVYPPLIEKVAFCTAKMICESEAYGREIKQFAVDLLGKALESGQIRKPIWLRYRRGLLLGDLGKAEEARASLLPVVRQKSSEYWAWRALAKVERQLDPAMALALYAKAYLSCRNDAIATGVLEDAVPLAVTAGRTDLAKWAVDKVITIRQHLGKGISESLEKGTATDWYKTATELKSPLETIAHCAVPAEELLLTGCWTRASFLGTVKAKGDKSQFKIGLSNGKDGAVVVCSVKRLRGFKNMEVGHRYWLRFNPVATARASWDINPGRMGVPSTALQRHTEFFIGTARASAMQVSSSRRPNTASYDTRISIPFKTGRLAPRSRSGTRERRRS